MVLAHGLLADADEDLRIGFNDFPIEAAQTEPPVINAKGVFGGIADHVDYVDRIATSVGFLDVDVNPDLALVNWTVANRVA